MNKINIYRYIYVYMHIYTAVSSSLQDLWVEYYNYNIEEKEKEDCFQTDYQLHLIVQQCEEIDLKTYHQD